MVTLQKHRNTQHLNVNDFLLHSFSQKCEACDGIEALILWWTFLYDVIVHRVLVSTGRCLGLQKRTPHIAAMHKLISSKRTVNKEVGEILLKKRKGGRLNA